MKIDRPPSPYVRLVSARAAQIHTDRARVESPASTGFEFMGSVISRLAKPGELGAVLSEAREWVEAAITAVQKSKGRKYLTREQVCEQLVAQLEKKHHAK